VLCCIQFRSLPFGSSTLDASNLLAWRHPLTWVRSGLYYTINQRREASAALQASASIYGHTGGRKQPNRLLFLRCIGWRPDMEHYPPRPRQRHVPRGPLRSPQLGLGFRPISPSKNG